ncbi:hypothetical protein TNCV_385771 [Trichonephila clavipes]|nr:hypothetical protein TNCV_385771 [Trichonephila clavipes]
MYQNSCGTSVVIVTGSRQACHEFDPCTAEDPPYRGGPYTLNMSRLKRPPVGVVRKIRERDSEGNKVVSYLRSNNESGIRMVMVTNSYPVSQKRLGAKSMIQSSRLKALTSG